MQSNRLHAIAWSLAIAEKIVWAGLYYVFAAMLVQWEHELHWSKVTLTRAFCKKTANFNH